MDVPEIGFQTLARQMGQRNERFLMPTSVLLEVALELSVPAGVDYDLYVDGSYCFVDPATSSSVKGTGQMEEITVWCDDTFAIDDSFYVDVEVRYFSGASCEPWELRVFRRAC